MGGGHPESPQRLKAIEAAIEADALLNAQLHRREAQPATREQLERVHPATYIDMLEGRSPKSGLIPLDGDTTMNPWSLKAAQLAAGAVVMATDLVLGGKAQRAFCAVRPPGHHAERSQAMGFCFFDSVAVGAAHALEHPDINKVAILDFDVHHGNGTEDIFGRDDRVLFGSTFQHPLYPYSGTEDGKSPLTVNVPLPAETGSHEFRRQVNLHWKPAVEKFEPDLIFISAGFDAHKDDPLASLRLTEEDFAWVTEQIVAWANTHCQGRVVSTLEGGYNLQALGRSVVAHLHALGK
jgi:acetoin utilization deacetylase AcuC-like enzyme